MTAQLIEELLGPNWWEREHDQTALCALLDRVMEASPCKPHRAIDKLFNITLVSSKLLVHSLNLKHQIIKAVYGHTK